MSAIYLDILKDRLYTSGAASPARRCAQSTLYELLVDLTRLMAPILSFTAEEIWSYLPGPHREDSVHLASFPEPRPGLTDEAILAKYEFLLKVRDEINRGLEEARKGKVLATAQEAMVQMAAQDADLVEKLRKNAPELKTLTQVAELTVAEGPGTLTQPLTAQEIPGLLIQVGKAAGEKCVRCWFTRTSVGQDSRHPQICHRCLEALEG
jgi:isoleucyl-tRNA synthetase